MPSGAALLAAAAVALAAGWGGDLAAALGLGRLPLALWAAAAAAASAINLGVPPHLPAVLVNPAGTVFAAAFGLFLLRRGAPRRRVALAALAAAVLLAVLPAWAEQAGVGWPATAAAGLGAALACSALGRTPAAALAGAALGLAGAVLLRAGGAVAGLAPWPATLGGGPSLDAGVLAAVAGQAVRWAPALGRAARPAAVALRPTAR